MSRQYDPDRVDFVEMMLLEIRWWMWPLAILFWVMIFMIGNAYGSDVGVSAPCISTKDYKCSYRFWPGDALGPRDQCHRSPDLVCEAFAPGQRCFGVKNQYGCATKPRCEGPRSTWNEPCDGPWLPAVVPTVPEGYND